MNIFIFGVEYFRFKYSVYPQWRKPNVCLKVKEEIGVRGTKETSIFNEVGFVSAFWKGIKKESSKQTNMIGARGRTLNWQYNSPFWQKKP